MMSSFPLNVQSLLIKWRGFVDEMRCPKSRFPIRIIVFDELDLIIFVSQGLTLSTASLVYFLFSKVAFLCMESMVNTYLHLSFSY